MKVNVNQSACIGCGACQAAAEELFVINDEGLSEITNEIVPNELKDKAIEAINSCPTDAIFEVNEENN